MRPLLARWWKSYRASAWMRRQRRLDARMDRRGE